MKGIIVAHIFFLIIKATVWGISEALQDIFAIMILFCGVSRLDYFMILLYMFTLMSMTFYMIVSIGFFLQVKNNKDAAERSPGERTNLVGKALSGQ